MNVWPLQDAKNRFSAVVDAALAGTPQRVTRRGKPAVVVVSVDDYERLRNLERAQAPSLAEMLLAIPQGDEEFERLQLEPRSFDLLIAATALEHGLTVVTGNVRHFEPTGVPALNPFASPD